MSSGLRPAHVVLAAVVAGAAGFAVGRLSARRAAVAATATAEAFRAALEEKAVAAGRDAQSRSLARGGADEGGRGGGGPHRVAFTMSVRTAELAEYTRRHDPARCPELLPVTAMLREHGVTGYSIFAGPPNAADGTTPLFACLRAVDLAALKATADTAACRRWWAYMAPLMTTNADDSPATGDLTEVFYMP